MQTIHTYQRLELSDARLIRTRIENDVESQLLAIQSPFGYRRIAEILSPLHGETLAAILYVHWYEPASPDSNRSQFVEEAMEMARRGAACLLIETLWSDPDFFSKRTQADDLQNSIEEVVNIRRSIDLLLSRSNIDFQRFAYVGHDFGGMYGVLAGSLDQRPSHYVIMAATPRFPDWYLYSPKPKGQAREEFIRQFSELDPIMHVTSLSPAPILFQFGTNDPHVPKQRAEEFFEEANEPKEIRWYEAGHGLNPNATNDRKDWLKRNLHLRE